MASRSSARRLGGLLLSAAVLAAGALTGCTTSLDQGDTGTTTDLAKVAVTGRPGAKPAIDVHAPFAATKIDRKVLVTGKGTLVQPGFRVTVDYLGINGTDGRQFATTWGLASTAFTLDAKQTLKGIVQGLSGVTVGSRVLLAIPPVDGYGTQGQATLGIGPTDSLVFVIDVNQASKVLTRATGRAVAPARGLPKVKLNARTGEPTITIPKSAAPTKLVTQTLIQGSGAKVAKGQTITTHYTGAIWPGGRQFDSTWTRNSPAYFVIGEGKVLAGWDEGLVGQRVGSQVMLVLPPDKAFGVLGKPEKGVKGTDTVVFVVDILDAASSTNTP